VNNSPKVLVVEDEAVMAMLYSRKLRSKGYTVTGTAATKEEAVNLAFKNPPDFVLMDIRLVGEGDGIDAAREIAAHRRDAMAWRPYGAQFDGLFLIYSRIRCNSWSFLIMWS
jgi:CheY-like chemotaxis protein